MAVFDEPVVILLAAAAATLLVLVEVALPTYGMAGLAALAFALLAAGATAHQDAVWWPLVGAPLAVLLWGVMIARRRARPAQHAAALAIFAFGIVGFGVANGDLVSVVVGCAATGAAGVLFPPAFEWVLRLLSSPPAVGIEALLGRRGVVVRWADSRGSVRVDGSLWNAAAAVPLRTHDEVLVVGAHAMELAVAPLETAWDSETTRGMDR